MANTKQINVPMTQFSKGLAEIATCAGWQLDRVSGKSHNILCYIMDRQDPTRVVSADSKNAPAQLKLDILTIDTSFIGNEKIRELYANKILTPLTANKQNFGQGGQQNLDEAYESVLNGDFEKAKVSLLVACGGNKKFMQKVTKGLNLLNEIAPTTVEEQIVALSQKKTTKRKTTLEDTKTL